jgi:hypothetical protein
VRRTSGSRFRLLAPASPRPRRKFSGIRGTRSTPALCPSDCFVTQPSSFSKSSSTFLQLLFRFHVVPPVFASSLRTRSSESVLLVFLFLFLFHPPTSLSHQLAAPSRDSVLAVPILISKQIPLELLALASRRKKVNYPQLIPNASILHIFLSSLWCCNCQFVLESYRELNFRQNEPWISLFWRK